MSRAFVDESAAESSEEGAPELKIPLPAGWKNYVTRAGAERLHAELSALLSQARPRLRETDRRIEYLSRMVAIMEVVDHGTRKPERVVFGATVRVHEEGSGIRVYRIVGVDESDPGKGLVSWISPLAKALKGKTPGESVTVRLPEGERKMRILAIGGDSE